MTKPPSGPRQTTSTKLRVLTTARSAYVHIFRNIGVYSAQIAVLAATVAIIGGAGVATGLLSRVVLNADVQRLSLAVGAALIAIAYGTACIGVAGMAVACHRAVLLDEGPSIGFPLRFRRRELRYLVLMVLCAVLVAVPPAVLIALVHSSFRDTPPLFIIGILAALLWYCIWPTFVMLAFPAVALDEPDPLRSAWRLSRGNRTRLSGLLVATIVPIYPIGLVIMTSSRLLPRTEAAWLETALAFAILFALDIIMILSLAAASSLAFQRLSREAADPRI